MLAITGVDVLPVNVPLKAPIRWAWGIRKAVTRSIIRVHTSDGVEGIGETMASPQITALIQSIAQRIQGQAPFDIEKILAQFELTPFFSGYSACAAVAGVEMALWDIMGKVAGRPVAQLLGGIVRDQVEFSAYVFPRYPGEAEGGETSAEEIADFCLNLRQQYGFQVFKVKGGIFAPEDDLAMIAAMRAKLGPSAKLRLDPNGVWSFTSALEMGKKLEAYDLEYLEDPVWGMDAMSRLRRDLPVPLATNMCVVDLDQIAPAVRLGAVDIILGDCHKWGGLWATKKLAAVCEAFGLGMSLHSGCELGVSTVAYLHLTASTPVIRYAIDSHYHHMVDDVLAGGKLAYSHGSMSLPLGPGLGVSLDPGKLQFFHQRFLEDGYEGSVGDSYRPDWVPRKVMW